MASIFTFGFLVFLPILQIAVGVTYRNDCPANISIPLWLIIQGIFMIFLVVSIVFFKYYDCSLMTSVIVVFLISWLIRGSIWVYRSNGDISFDPQQNIYCNRICYNVAFWSVTSIWTLVGFFILGIVLALFCSKNSN